MRKDGHLSAMRDIALTITAMLLLSGCVTEGSVADDVANCDRPGLRQLTLVDTPEKAKAIFLALQRRYVPEELPQESNRVVVEDQRGQWSVWIGDTFRDEGGKNVEVNGGYAMTIRKCDGAIVTAGPYH
jgi:hypothetical protein